MEWCKIFLEHGIRPSSTGIIIVLADVESCFVMSRTQPFRRLPAYCDRQRGTDLGLSQLVRESHRSDLDRKRIHGRVRHWPCRNWRCY